MRKIVVSVLVALAVAACVVWSMTRSWGGGEAAAARTACVSINAYAKQVGFDARTARSERANPSPTPTPGVSELVRGARDPKAGGIAKLHRLETWCVGRGYGPTPTP